MAIDTATERRSASSLLVVSPGVTPSSTATEAWRVQAACTYCGIDIDEPVFTWELQAYISSNWVNVSSDVMVWDYDIVAERGIDGNGVTDLVATPGSLSCVLDNGEANSAGLLGYYSWDHPNLRSGVEKGLPLRLKFSYAGDFKFVWRGKLDDLTATAGQFQERVAFLVAFDFMKEFTDGKLSRIPVQESKRSDQVMQTILDNMSATPANSSLVTDTYTTQLALHTEQDERSTPMSATQKICQSALGYAYIRGDTTDGETFVFELRSTRVATTSAATLHDTMSELEISRGDKRFANKITGTYHPANVDSGASTILAGLLNEFELGAGETETITLRYRDPNNTAVRISGKDVVDPLVADTHFKMSSSSGDNGNDLNANLSSDITAGGNASDVEVTNSAGVTGYINKLNIVGNGVYQYEPGEVIIESGDANKAITYDFFYQDDYYKVKDLTTDLHTRTSSDITYVDSVSFYADASSALMSCAMSCDIGSRVTIEETATGVAGEYTINKVTYTIQTDSRLKVEWVLEHAQSYDFFQLDISGLDGTDVLSPF